MVNQLPDVAEGSERKMWFAAKKTIYIMDSQQDAAAYAGVGLAGAIRATMVLSPMRSRDLATGSGSGERHEEAGLVDARSVEADLWITEQQTGCSVLILDWGKGRYSMVHLQPYDDEQFNGWSRAVMGLGEYTCGLTDRRFFRSAYVNAWLKHDASSVVSSTGRAPQGYILVQTMFENARQQESQLIGIRYRSRFRFFRQRVLGPKSTHVEELRWSGWWSWLPSFTSRAY